MQHGLRPSTASSNWKWYGVNVRMVKTQKIKRTRKYKNQNRFMCVSNCGLHVGYGTQPTSANLRILRDGWLGGILWRISYNRQTYVFANLVRLILLLYPRNVKSAINSKKGEVLSNDIQTMLLFLHVNKGRVCMVLEDIRDSFSKGRCM